MRAGHEGEMFIYVPLDDGISLIASLMLVKAPSQFLSVSAYATSRHSVSRTETRNTPEVYGREKMKSVFIIVRSMALAFLACSTQPCEL